MAGLHVPSSDGRRETLDDHEQQLNQIIASYLETNEAGQPADREVLLKQFPDLAHELALFFANQDHVGRIAAPLRRGNRSTFIPDSNPAIMIFPASPHDDETPSSDRLHARVSPETHVHYFGDYELIEILAQGGMGVIYKARQVSLNRLLALKMVRAGRFATSGDLERFRLEAEAAAHLEHPHIVPIHEVGEHDGHHYFSMKLVEGGNLAAQVERYTDHPRAAARLVATVASAVHYAHERGILHRDLKPSNILLSGPADAPLQELVPLVSDFGLAKWVENGRHAAELTHSGSIVGTPGYMAPEQAEGRRETITTAADVHAIGAILFELLTGRPPYRAETVLETLRLICEQEPVRPRLINPRIARDLETIVLKCLEKSPRRRYASAAALADDLDRWLADLPIRARRVTLPQRTVLWARRRPAAATFAILAVLAAATVAGTIMVVKQTHQELREVHQQYSSLKTELVASRERKLRMEEDYYFQQIVAVDQSLAAHDPARAHQLLADCPPRLRNWEWYHLSRRTHPAIATIQGHSGLLCGSDFRPDMGSSACSERSLGDPVWNVTHGRMPHRIHGLDGTAYGMVFDRPGVRIATAGADGQVKVWDLSQGNLISVFRGHVGWTAGVAFSPDGTKLASAGQDDTVRIWDVSPHSNASAQRSTPSQFLRVRQGGIFGLAFSEQGTALATAGQDGTVQVWSLAADPPRLSRKFQASDQEVCCVAFSPDGTTLVSGGADRKIKIWDLATRRPSSVIGAATSRVNAVAFSPDGSKLASGGLDNLVNIWESATGRPVAVFAGHAAPVFRVEFSHDGTKLISASQDAVIKLWDLASEPGVRRFELANETVQRRGIPGQEAQAQAAAVRWIGGVAFQPSGRALAAGGNHHTVGVWDAVSGRLDRHFRDGWGATVAVAYNHNGTQLAAAGSDRVVRIWDGESNAQPREISDPREGFASLAFNPYGHILATGGGDPPEVMQAPAGKFARAESESRTIRFWNSSTGALIRSMNGHTGSVYALSFSADGCRLASAGSDGIVRIWNAATGELSLTLKGHLNAVFGLAFSPDGNRLVSAGEDRTLRSWNVEDGRLLDVLEGHTNWVMGVAYSPDGSRIASAGADQTVRVWDPARGREVLILHGPHDRVFGVAFSPRDASLAGASADGIVRVWEAEAGVTPVLD